LTQQSSTRLRAPDYIRLVIPREVDGRNCDKFLKIRANLRHEIVDALCQ
jgi:hypothetical protein